MASAADLRKELDCSICLAVYTDPVTLRCGHSFCQGCIAPLLDTQEASERYSCPECREEFAEKPALNKNVTLNNIAKAFQAAELDQKNTRILCTYCIHSPVPAVKFCLHCEASLCQDHLSVHSKSPEHVLSDHTDHQETRKCSIHKKILEYYCKVDAPCICTSCQITEEQWGHLMNEASEKKKEGFTNVMKDILNQKQKIEERVQILQERQRKIPKKSDHKSKKLAPQFRDIKNQLEDLEKRVLRSQRVTNLIQKLELKKKELSEKMAHMEELSNTSDPLALLQEPDIDDLCDAELEDDDTDDAGVGLDITKISGTLQITFDIITGVNLCFYRRNKTAISLDNSTACKYMKIDGNAALAPNSYSIYADTPKRFQDANQVLSRETFGSGQHYWDVEIYYDFSMGMCYPSADRKGKQVKIGYNDKSWGLQRLNGQVSVIHDMKAIVLPYVPTCSQFRIYLDYERGQISCYALVDPIHHIYTFNATFTEPLHAVFGTLINSVGLDKYGKRIEYKCLQVL